MLVGGTIGQFIPSPESRRTMLVIIGTTNGTTEFAKQSFPPASLPSTTLACPRVLAGPGSANIARMYHSTGSSPPRCIHVDRRVEPQHRRRARALSDGRPTPPRSFPPPYLASNVLQTLSYGGRTSMWPSPRPRTWVHLPT
ncbi:hypothetical protein OG21DRAFT_1505648 [Imleria badia]|nr:hypothetical protein OG21DRAFT_1505648 [Imleria badia]